MSASLKKWTGQSWMISRSTEEGDDSLYEQDIAEQNALKKMILSNELIKSVLNNFEDANITDIRKIKDEFTLPMEGLDDNYLISSDEFGLDEFE